MLPAHPTKRCSSEEERWSQMETQRKEWRATKMVNIYINMSDYWLGKTVIVAMIIWGLKYIELKITTVVADKAGGG